MKKEPSFLSVDEELQPLTDGYAADATFAPITDTEDASQEEETFLSAVMDYFMGYIYSDEGLSKVVQAMKQDKRELFEKIPDIVEPILKRAKLEVEGAGGEIPASVWFGEGGALQSANDLMFEIAQQSDIPGSMDKDQYAASLMQLYGKAGQAIEEEGDPNAVREAEDLMMEMAIGAQGGDVSAIKKAPKHKNLAASVGQGLLGMGE